MCEIGRIIISSPDPPRANLLEARKSEIDALMRPIEGFASYLLVRTGAGGTTVTVCESKVGTGTVKPT
jgi:hypothetical protein